MLSRYLVYKFLEYLVQRDGVAKVSFPVTVTPDCHRPGAHLCVCVSVHARVCFGLVSH